jgi:hypothetical protein
VRNSAAPCKKYPGRITGIAGISIYLPKLGAALSAGVRSVIGTAATSATQTNSSPRYPMRPQ